MSDTTEIVWLLGQLTVVVLAIWFVVKTVFFRRTSRRATRSSLVGEGIFMLVVAALWAGYAS